jgi:Cu(I)/Ag(I) efflux system membrane fusion protein
MMLAIVNLNKVWVKAEVFGADIFKVSVGDNAIVSLDYQPNQQWLGKVQHIHPMLNPNTRTGIARLQVDNPLGVLKPNMFAQVSIENHNNTSVLQLPRDAIIRTGSQDRVVLALGDGYFKSVAVTLGRSNRHNIEIISGVVAGDSVVSAAQFLLDSESSKQSDFKRMHSDADDTEQRTTPHLMHEHKMNTNQNLTNKSAHTVASSTVPSSTITSTTVSAETAPSAIVPSAMVHGTVVSVKPEQRQVTINREAIAKWHREAATVTFTVHEAVDMSLFTQDAYLMFTFEVKPDDLVILNAMVMHEGMSHNMHYGESHD